MDRQAGDLKKNTALVSEIFITPAPCLIRKRSRAEGSHSANMPRLLFALLLLTASASAAREVVNFDFSWRHRLGNPGNHSAKCAPGEAGKNYGTGGDLTSGVASAAACCAMYDYGILP